MYHSSIGGLHLLFVLLTFFTGSKFTYFTSIFLMLPVYIVEFIVIYGMGIPSLNEMAFFQFTKQFFVAKMHSPILEKSLYFMNLAFLFQTISCLKLMFI